jgi:hypothetical protein
VLAQASIPLVMHQLFPGVRIGNRLLWANAGVIVPVARLTVE